MKANRYIKAALEKSAKRRRRNEAAMRLIEGQSPNAIAAVLARTGDAFLVSPEWKAMRVKVFEKYGRKCMKCGFIPGRGQRLNVDHIKPRCFYPELTTVFDNLQVLCEPCNQAKGNKHSTDYRPRTAA